MGSIDTLEILGVEASPPSLLLRSHRHHTDAAVSLDPSSAKSFLTNLATSDKDTYWLRSVSLSKRPFLFWHLSGNYKILVRIKQGSSRSHLEVSCSKHVYRALLATLRAEWSGTA